MQEPMKRVDTQRVVKVGKYVLENLCKINCTIVAVQHDILNAGQRVPSGHEKHKL